MEWFKTILVIMAGGSLGAVCRYGVSRVAASWLPGRFPLGTLLVNLTGCFLIGAAFALAERTQVMNPSARLFFMTGFLGSLTTFSTYGLETVQSVRSGAMTTAALNIFINNLGGVALVFLGIWLTAWLLDGR